MKLLIIEDNARLAAVMTKLLTDNGMTVDAVATVEEARAALALGTYDLILLDLALPDGYGGDLLRTLRNAGEATPVLVATARGDITDRVQLLNAGADDYLVKPFSLDELLARIRAVLRRPRQTAPNLLQAGNLALDAVSQTLTIDGIPVELPRLELRVLSALLGQRGKLLARERLEQAVYSTDAEITPNAIEAAVSRLRRRLEARGASVTITAMRGLGYMFDPRV
jgi:DNA-binding response OmpR family regulator